MIENWGNKIAEDVWAKGRSSKLPREYHLRAKLILEVMHASSTVADLVAMTVPPSLRLHHLHGDRKGEIAVDILGPTHPWRIVFLFQGGHFCDVMIENYH